MGEFATGVIVGLALVAGCYYVGNRIGDWLYKKFTLRDETKT